MRGPACQALPTICRHLDVDVVKQSVRPCLIELSKDCADRVRELLAEHLIELAPIFGRKHTRELLLEPMLTLLRDKTPAVRAYCPAPAQQLCCTAICEVPPQACLGVQSWCCRAVAVLDAARRGCRCG